MNSQNLEIQNQKLVDKHGNADTVNIQKEKEKDKLSPELIEKVIEDLKKKLSMLNTQLQIKIDKDTDIVVVKVIDKETNKIIRQIPPEYVLKIAKYLDEIAGLLYNEKA
ncbi:flagellar protein FlaG [Desulfurobacterium thermolithotrophum]|uniref:flagellar protein FlaG n=1 Tax=Desulfurobacterium thermolithotrophum TaxID=64160 RepID=UPI00398490B0